MKSLRACLKALRALSVPLRWRMAVTVAIGLGRIAASLAFVWASKHLVDIATGVSSQSLPPAIGLFLGILLLQLGAIVLGNWWNGYNQVKAQNLLRV